MDFGLGRNNSNYQKTRIPYWLLMLRTKRLEKSGLQMLLQFSMVGMAKGLLSM